MKPESKFLQYRGRRPIANKEITANASMVESNGLLVTIEDKDPPMTQR